MKRFFLILLAALTILPTATAAKKKNADIKVISYNIRLGVANDGTNSWEYRYPASAMMILDQKPDIFGLQEAYDFQVKYLEEYCEDYKSVGVGREDGKHEGEHMSIFYNKKTVKLIKWGGGDLITAEREQWNDGSNTLCIAPGKVIVYERNNVTNAILRDEGITVLEIPSSELSRGRGGPRCMSMPLWREN